MMLQENERLGRNSVHLRLGGVPAEKEVIELAKDRREHLRNTWDIYFTESAIRLDAIGLILQILRQQDGIHIALGVVSKEP